MPDAKPTPGEWRAMRADEFDRIHGRMHLSTAIYSPPLDPASDDASPEIVAYVDSLGDSNLFLVAKSLLEALSAPTWLVWSNEHGAWWGPNQCHYYTDISAAGRYTLEEAIRITGMRGGSRKSRQTGNPSEMIHPSPEWIEARTTVIRKATGGA